MARVATIEEMEAALEELATALERRPNPSDERAFVRYLKIYEQRCDEMKLQGALWTE